MTLTAIILLIIIGLIFIILEILVIPGTTFVGVVGFLIMVLGVFFAYLDYGTLTGHITLVGTLLTTLLVVYFAFKSKTWKKLMLHASVDGKVNTFEDDFVKSGDIGITISRLNPMGKATINGQDVEVQSSGDFINENTEIKVIKVQGNKIYVTSV